MSVSKAVSLSYIKHVWLGDTSTVREHFPALVNSEQVRCRWRQNTSMWSCVVSHIVAWPYTQLGHVGNLQWKSVRPKFMKNSSIIAWLLLARNNGTVHTTCCQSAKNSSNQKIRETKGLQINVELWLSSDRYNANFSTRLACSMKCVWNSCCNTKFYCGPIVTVLKFSAAPSPQHHILVWPPLYSVKFSAASTIVSNISVAPTTQYQILL
jgi:hypothetical protein